MRKTQIDEMQNLNVLRVMAMCISICNIAWKKEKMYGAEKLTTISQFARNETKFNAVMVMGDLSEQCVSMWQHCILSRGTYSC